MSTPPIYTFPRGEPVIIGRQVQSGDPAGFTVEADLKPTRAMVVPAESVVPTASFSVTFVAASGAEPAHWLLTIAGPLPVGHYCTDARFVKDAQTVSISQPAFITIAESVSG